MKREFVAYEQALALKELGFDEPCFKKYIAGCLWSSPTTPETYQKIHLNSSDCLAPLYQQAFRWFREKYNLKGFVSPVEYLDGTNDTYHWCIYNECNSGNDQLTHEEAELACLIKLIEIVKEK